LKKKPIVFLNVFAAHSSHLSADFTGPFHSVLDGVPPGFRQTKAHWEVRMARFKHEAFQEHMSSFVDELDDEDFNRSWEIVVACIEAHSRIDREPKESKLKSMSRAWEDFALAAQGELATHAMLGLLEELVAMCPASYRFDGSIDRRLCESIALGRGHPEFVRWGHAVRNDPLLYLIEGGRMELGDPLF
jgi:hypothetical protein